MDAYFCSCVSPSSYSSSSYKIFIPFSFHLVFGDVSIPSMLVSWHFYTYFTERPLSMFVFVWLLLNVNKPFEHALQIVQYSVFSIWASEPIAQQLLNNTVALFRMLSFPKWIPIEFKTKLDALDTKKNTIRSLSMNTVILWENLRKHASHKDV